MEFRIRETVAGWFEIIETQPVIRGSFPDHDTARLCMSFLIEDAMENAEDARSDLSVPAAPSETPARPHDFTEAFRRRRNGERLKDIAADMDLHFNSLRSAWAGHCNARKAVEKAAAPPPSRPALPVPAQEVCTLCSREFTPSIANPDTCARCTKDVS